MAQKRITRSGSAIKACLCLILLSGMIYGLSHPFGSLPPFSLWLDTWHGVYATARSAAYKTSQEVLIPQTSAPVQVIRDERGVPHIFAQNDNDAALALGYVMASDRLFQMDLYRRAASGKLSEIIGASVVENDKALRRTGMYLGAQRTNEALKQENSPAYQAMQKFAQGVNAYLASLSDHELPFECRLLGYRPREWDTYSTCLILQYMCYDLTFSQDDIYDAVRRSAIGDNVFDELYPEHSLYPVPHNPEPRGIISNEEVTRRLIGNSSSSVTMQTSSQAVLSVVPTKSNLASMAQKKKLLSSFDTQTNADFAAALSEFYRLTMPFVGEIQEGKGSNNWVVSGKKTISRKPILAGDPHLSLSLPAIWYETHIVTPKSNVYGVTIPGTPTVIIGGSQYCAWTFTNTGADVLDYYAIEFDAAKKRYRYDTTWRDLKEDITTMKVKNSADIRDTVLLTHYGPVMTDYRGKRLAIQWTAHGVSTTPQALWHFNHATNYREFEVGMKLWNVPAQNVAYADAQGNISLRSCGTIPIRRAGNGKYIFNGATNEGDWVGSIPFEQLPAGVNPERGWLASANQEPGPPDYPYYMMNGWGFTNRGTRIQQMLEESPKLQSDAMRTMQTDVTVIPFAMLKPALTKAIQDILAHETLPALNTAVLHSLAAWNGIADVENKQALVFTHVLPLIKKLTFDEIVDTLGLPPDDVLYRLLNEQPTSKWFDLQSTPAKEDAHTIMKYAIKNGIDSTIAKFGSDTTVWVWGKQHKLVIRHVLRDAMRPLGRYDMPFAGFGSTVMPASGLRPSFSASWRMVADFSDGEPKLMGGFPGGSSGNPANPYYTKNLQTWLKGELYPLHRVKTPDELASRISTIIIK